MALSPGTRLGPYEVTSQIGVGGMGEVYRATDTNLGRQVAIKVLPDAVARDAERLTRFDREARALAALNHPNVAAIYGLETGDGRPAIVMELVDGLTLADRIASGPIGVAETIAIGVQIAGAVEAAHERGVVHRDLKPANIKVRPDGTVKVLDFGLAKALSAGVPGADAATVTLSSPSAGPGPGTPRYMSPEQARGQPVDHRTDIWAIGCVLYEMLAGRPAFEGAGVSDILSRVLQTEPDWSRLPDSVPPSLRRLLRRCLEKHLRQRRQSAGDVRLDLEEATAEPDAAQASPARRSRWATLAWIAGAAVAVLLAIPAVEHLRERPQRQMRLQLVTPATPDPRHFALSPDGLSVTYVAVESDGVQRLHVRALDQTDGRALAGTDGARYPFWSPDSQSIGFFASDRLHRIAADGGPVADLAPATNPLGGTWSQDGTILYAPESTSPLRRVPDDGGGMPRVVTGFETGQVNHRWPTFLPDGRRFLFYAAGEQAVSGLYVGSLDDGAITRLGPADDRAAVFVEPDHVVFVQQGALVARRLDGGRAAFVGDLLTLVPAPDDAAAGISGLSASSTGTLAYRTGEPIGVELIWLDRDGNVRGSFPDGNGPELSPDGRYIAVDRTIDGNRDVWRLDPDRGDYTRLTTHPAVDGYPVWSPDGRQLVFETRRNGTFDLFVRSSSGGGAEEPLLVSSSDHLIPFDWSPNGFLLYRRDDDTFTAADLLALPMTGGDAPPLEVATSPFEERTGAFSPDGRLVAYDTNESGRFEVRVQAFPDPDGWVQVSTGGGEAPRWTSDEEVVFVAPDGAIMAARVSARGTTLEVEAPERLFPTRVWGQTFNQQYDVSSDGRFLVYNLREDSPPSPITLLLNWRP